MRRLMKCWLLPILLIGLGVWLTSGCIYIPTFNVVVKGKDVSDKVGPGDSKAALRVGAASREQVLALLGNPFYATPDDRYWVYTWERQQGAMVFPLCFAAGTDRTDHAITIEFDDSGRMNGLETERPHESNWLWGNVRGLSVPDKVRLYEAAMNGDANTTRPVTGPGPATTRSTRD